MEEEDKILEQQKINEKITLAKEIVENNKILALNTMSYDLTNNKHISKIISVVKQKFKEK